VESDELSILGQILQHIGILYQLQEDLAALVALQIEGDTPLIAIYTCEIT
jgi:hypothetical protein